MTALASRISWWGVACLLLVVVSFVMFQYNFYLHDAGHQAPFSTLTNYKLCVVMQTAAAVCGTIATRRGSWSWAFVVVAATFMAIGCYFSEL